jgi:O-acetyl-ADP-ribose deacetylase (regulator of RNase III)
MSVQFTSGDLLNCDQAVALVNPVNCVGVMGKGLALAVRKRWPENFRAYRSACAAGKVRIGAPHVYETLSGTHPRVIVNLPTKIHWRDPSELEATFSPMATVDAIIFEPS